MTIIQAVYRPSSVLHLFQASCFSTNEQKFHTIFNYHFHHSINKVNTQASSFLVFLILFFAVGGGKEEAVEILLLEYLQNIKNLLCNIFLLNISTFLLNLIRMNA